MQTIFRSVGRTFPFHRRSTLRYCGGLLAALGWMAWGAAPAQTTICALGTTALLVGPSAGTISVVLAVAPATGAWTATANAAWLHLAVGNQSGTGSTNVVFNCDANPGATRTGQHHPARPDHSRHAGCDRHAADPGRRADAWQRRLPVFLQQHPGRMLHRAVHHQPVAAVDHLDGGRRLHEHRSQPVPVHLAADDERLATILHHPLALEL